MPVRVLKIMAFPVRVVKKYCFKIVGWLENLLMTNEFPIRHYRHLCVYVLVDVLKCVSLVL